MLGFLAQALVETIVVTLVEMVLVNFFTHSLRVYVDIYRLDSASACKVVLPAKPVYNLRLLIRGTHVRHSASFQPGKTIWSAHRG